MLLHGKHYKTIEDYKIIFNDYTCVYFGKGKFDTYAVIYKTKRIKYYSKDYEYFSVLKNIANLLGKEKIYNDLLYIINNTSWKIDKKVVIYINNIVNSYKEIKVPKEIIFKTYIVIYMTMIAEECKENAILGKRIKHLAIYNILIEDYPIKYVIKYMNGKSAKYLNKLCEERNI